MKVHVLGPPDLTQTEKIRKQRSRDPDQFWHLVSGGAALQRAEPAVDGPGLGREGGSASRCPPRRAGSAIASRACNGQQLLEIVRTLDHQMNNTSLILLFEVFGKKLLFPGDAQIENWSYALRGCARTRRRLAALLADVDVYKVGHHGSLNATPKRLLWEEFRKRNKRSADAAVDHARQARQLAEQYGGAAVDAAEGAGDAQQAAEHHEAENRR